MKNENHLSLAPLCCYFILSIKIYSSFDFKQCLIACFFMQRLMTSRFDKTVSK